MTSLQDDEIQALKKSADNYFQDNNISCETNEELLKMPKMDSYPCVISSTLKNNIYCYVTVKFRERENNTLYTFVGHAGGTGGKDVVIICNDAIIYFNSLEELTKTNYFSIAMVQGSVHVNWKNGCGAIGKCNTNKGGMYSGRGKWKMENGK
jgi:hypothetical protein